MGNIVIMPKQGLQMTEGLIIEWFVKEGEPVTEGQPLFEMETDKVAITIDASASGTLLKILCEEGEIAEVASPVAVIGEPGEDYEAILSGDSSNQEEETDTAPQVENRVLSSSKIVIMPKQGLQMTEGMITEWFIKEGESVTEGQPLFEMETDKVAITIDAPTSGTLLKIL